MSFTHSKNAAGKPRVATSKSRAGGSKKPFKNIVKSYSEPDDLITHSTGNVFDDVGFPPHEACRLFLRSQLVVAIVKLIERRNLTQREAAKLFGVTQPRISDLIRGKLDLFSIDMLITMLGRAGVEIGLTFHPKAA